MSSNSLVSQTPPLGAGNSGPQIVVDALTRLIRDQFPAIVPGAAISAALVRQVFDFVKQNLTVLLSGVLTTAGLAVLLPSLAVVLVNLAGFSASGVVAGTLNPFKMDVESLTVVLFIYRFPCGCYSGINIWWVYRWHVRRVSVVWCNSRGCTSCCSLRRHVTCYWGWGGRLLVVSEEATSFGCRGPGRREQ